MGPPLRKISGSALGLHVKVLYQTSPFNVPITLRKKAFANIVVIGQNIVFVDVCDYISMLYVGSIHNHFRHNPISNEPPAWVAQW